MGGVDIDSLNCMETLDKKISPTDEELLVRTFFSDEMQIVALMINYFKIVELPHLLLTSLST
jgi:hypothetical protein